MTGVALSMQSMAVLAPYALSSDVYSYAMYGRIFAVHGGSQHNRAAQDHIRAVGLDAADLGHAQSLPDRSVQRSSQTWSDGQM